MAHSVQTSAPEAPGGATKQPAARAARTKSTYPYWFLVPGGLIFALFFLVPSAISFYFSLTRWTLFDQEFIGLDNFRQFFAEPALVSGLTHPLIYAAVTSGLKVVFGMALAVLLISQGFPVGRIRLHIVERGNRPGGVAKGGMARDVPDPLAADIDDAAVAQQFQMLLARAQHRPLLL